jgi:chromosome segregation ATPase
VDQLKAELNLLRSQEIAQVEEETGRLEALQAENDRLNQQVASLNAELAALNNRLESVYREQRSADPAEQEEKARLQAELELLRKQYSALKAEKEDSSNVARELEAYRRAERTERLARERAELVYHQVNGVLADATVRVEDASAQLGDLTDRVSAQLKQLQEAVTGSRQALADASSTLYAIRPTGDNS